MKTIAGYTDAISVRPGQTVAFKVSVEEGPATYRASLVRLTNMDAHRDGPGLIERVVPSPFDGDHEGRCREIRIGSWIHVPRTPALDSLSSFSVRAAVWPTTPGSGRQVLISTLSPDEGAGFALELTREGAVALRLGTAAEAPFHLQTGVALLEREWAFAAASYDSRTGEVLIVQIPARAYCGADTTAAAKGTITGAALPGGAGALSIAARAVSPDATLPKVGDHYNGKIDGPAVLGRSLGADALAEWAREGAAPDGCAALVAAWDFSRDIGSETVTDRSANTMHGQTVNLPGRGMKGAAWTGEWQDWKAMPSHYGAIHFHDDDLADCGWESDFTYMVPQDLASGIYAAKLENGGEPEYVVFYVRPPKGRTGAPVCFLASTATYMAYANYRVMNRSALYEMYLAAVPELVPSDLFLNTRPHYGDSLYTEHSDGSGMSISTRLRPIVNMRPNSTLSEFNDDGFLLGWLEHCGIDVDVLTDEDLDREGIDALQGYRVVITGNHPEYVSTPMWDALQAFTARGGRMMYLGGNGFYWRVAFHPTIDGVIELRRAEDGSRPWDSEPGEYYMSFTGEYGGLWRRCGRTPNELTGVGFTASGFDSGRPYARTQASFDPRAAFIFDGVGADEIIGDFGIVGDGAAGQEIDRHDRRLGSPPHALVVATATGHTDYMVIAKEDMPATNPLIGASENPLVRADMTFFETANGGAVFSVGSMSWIPSLPIDGFANNVARITGNVLRRFLDETPFLPDGKGPR